MHKNHDKNDNDKMIMKQQQQQPTATTTMNNNDKQNKQNYQQRQQTTEKQTQNIKQDRLYKTRTKKQCKKTMTINKTKNDHKEKNKQ